MVLPEHRLLSNYCIGPLVCAHRNEHQTKLSAFFGKAFVLLKLGEKSKQLPFILCIAYQPLPLSQSANYEGRHFRVLVGEEGAREIIFRQGNHALNDLS